MRGLIAIVVWCLVLSACAQPETRPRREGVEGVAPNIVDEEPAPLGSPAPPGDVVANGSGEDRGDARGTLASPTPVAPTEATATPAPSSGSAQVAPSPTPLSPAPAPASTGREPVLLLAVADATGDHGVRGPDWMDLTSVEFVEVQERLRATLRFAGDVPATPPEEEVPLIGVDIGEEGYQLFLEGGNDSGKWAAYLDTPSGLVVYPGTFRIAGRAIVLEVGFNEVGSPTRAPVRVFAEWSRESLLMNPTSRDTLDGQPHTFDRNP